MIWVGLAIGLLVGAAIAIGIIGNQVRKGFHW
jgi:F0F1-type ATP synthase membrane subunit c/vacuolar-type H+-ATPase subunit K